MLRFEDVGPGGEYSTEEDLNKLWIIGDYLQSEGVPFHVAMIPRFIHPPSGCDNSISTLTDPFIAGFVNTLKHLQKCGASIGMHGYTHQYNGSIGGLIEGQHDGSISGYGFEFGIPDEETIQLQPPDDPEVTLYSPIAFAASYIHQVASVMVLI
jgi:hypothetical protein